jgi:hypothetical protein
LPTLNPQRPIRILRGTQSKQFLRLNRASVGTQELRLRPQDAVSQPVNLPTEARRAPPRQTLKVLGSCRARLPQPGPLRGRPGLRSRRLSRRPMMICDSSNPRPGAMRNPSLNLPSPPATPRSRPPLNLPGPNHGRAIAPLLLRPSSRVRPRATPTISIRVEALKLSPPAIASRINRTPTKPPPNRTRTRHLTITIPEYRIPQPPQTQQRPHRTWPRLMPRTQRQRQAQRNGEPQRRPLSLETPMRTTLLSRPQETQPTTLLLPTPRSHRHCKASACGRRLLKLGVRRPRTANNCSSSNRGSSTDSNTISSHSNSRATTGT